MKILLTGGSGFIGRNILEGLQSKYEILSPSSSELDLLDSKKVELYLLTHRFDLVIHAAHHDPYLYNSTKDKTKILENNLKMFFNLVNQEHLFGRMLYFGSWAEFDRTCWKPKMQETYLGRNIPTDPYDFSKYIMTMYTKKSKNITNFRLFNVFGKYEDYNNRLISNLCYKAVIGDKLELRDNKIYDFLYIKDLVKLVDLFISHPYPFIGNTYNICSGNTNSFKEVAEIVNKVSVRDLPVRYPTNIPKEYSGDNLKLQIDTKSFKFTPIEQAITELYEWYKENLDEQMQNM